MGEKRRLLGEERSATHPHSREQTNFATFRHLGLGVLSAPKASCSGLAWTPRLAFLHNNYNIIVKLQKDYNDYSDYNDYNEYN